MSSKIVPLGSQVHVHEVEESMYSGQIILVNESKLIRYEVIAIGPDCEVIKVGDKCIIGQYARFQIKGVEKQWLIEETAILARVVEVKDKIEKKCPSRK